MLKIITILGTRPEIIRLSRIISILDKYSNHQLIHTGQNFDFELNKIFFDELKIRKPNFFLEAAGKTAAETIAITGFFNAGQDCTAATRVIVQENVYDKFVELLAAQAKNNIATGSPDEDVLYGALNNADQLARVSGFVDRTPAHAKIVAGGKKIDRPGYFFAPTVIAGLHQDDEMIQNEIFGPVITVQKFKDEAEAVVMANGVAYGLASSVWTSNHGRAMRMAKAFDFGCVWINTHIPIVAEMPHGGFKRSGYGKDLSSYGFEDYTRIKHVMTNLNA